MNMVFRVPIQGFTSVGLSAHVTKPSSWVQMTTVTIVCMVNPFLFQEIHKNKKRHFFKKHIYSLISLMM